MKSATYVGYIRGSTKKSKSDSTGTRPVSKDSVGVITLNYGQWDWQLSALGENDKKHNISQFHWTHLSLILRTDVTTPRLYVFMPAWQCYLVQGEYSSALQTDWCLMHDQFSVT